MRTDRPGWPGKLLLLALAALLMTAGCGRRTPSYPDGGPPGDGGPWPPPPPGDWGPIYTDGGPWMADLPWWWPDRGPGWPDQPKPWVDGGVVSEKVTCEFHGSTTMQECYSDRGQACKGVSSCTVVVSGMPGPVQWKSTCGGYASTYLDGMNDVAPFKCPGVPQVTELVTCLFSGPGLQSCKSMLGGCSGTGSCQVQVSGPPGLKLSWSSTCPTPPQVTVLDGIDEKVSFNCGTAVVEPVTCIFTGSKTLQECVSTKGTSCQGIGSCTVMVSGLSGEKVDWKSTCGGYATTIIDGKPESITFACGSTPVSETVTCLFKGSTTYQQCYASTGQSCQGLLGCTILIKGNLGETVTWKSSCAGLATSITDGKDESVSFYCPGLKDGGVPPPPPIWPDAGWP